ncbi:hypothetical protein GOBAR_AA28932 [Gossypium barbadense]|uniref:Uncharacterized protein n=1 Tax=Gossypium barbadense TaxID=3634 RepID=A0A2P5WKY2_GOSBA|nr:hypothetical protein GOBAR_AA28932 [Gossypium barbadense]
MSGFLVAEDRHISVRPLYAVCTSRSSETTSNPSATRLPHKRKERVAGIFDDDWHSTPVLMLYQRLRFRHPVANIVNDFVSSTCPVSVLFRVSLYRSLRNHQQRFQQVWDAFFSSFPLVIIFFYF